MNDGVLPSELAFNFSGLPDCQIIFNCGQAGVAQ